MRRVRTYGAALLALIVVAFASGAAFPGSLEPAPTRTDLTRSYVLPYRIALAPASDVMETTMLALVNQSREAAGLQPLKVNPTLRAVARRHGGDMFSYGYFSHRSRNGRLPLDRVVAAGLSPWHVGENLAYAADVREAHRLLMNSPDHRENILSPIYRWVGIAVMDGGPHGVIVVEDFTD